MTTFTKFWAPSAQWGKMGGFERLQRSRILSAKPDDFSTADFHQMWPGYLKPCALEMYREIFSKKIHLVVICPQKPQNWRGQTRTLLRPVYSPGTHCSLHVVVQGPMTNEFSRSGQLFVRRTISKLRGVKVPQFSHFCLFSTHTKSLTVLSCEDATA